MSNQEETKMTRVNCIPIHELVDQHLFAEYREITRIYKKARVLKDYGHYKMGKGHVLFFYDKGQYLIKRTEDLYQECIRRGMNVTHKIYQPHPTGLNNNWNPTPDDEMVSASRINDKLDEKPDLYRYEGRKIIDKYSGVL